MKLKNIILLLSLLSIVSSCGKNKPENLLINEISSVHKDISKNERKQISENSSLKEKIEAEIKKSFKTTGYAKVAILYYLDNKIHKENVYKWIQSLNGKIKFASLKFGYVDFEVSWKDLGNLLDRTGLLGLNHDHYFKIELMDSKTKVISSGPTFEVENNTNSSFKGKVHSAAYGSKLSEFKQVVSKDLNIPKSSLNGKGTSVAVYDSGIHLGRADLFNTRLKDFFVGTDKEWQEPKLSIKDYLKLAKLNELSNELKVIKNNGPVKFLKISESTYSIDFNKNGNKSDTLILAVQEINSKIKIYIKNSLHTTSKFKGPYYDYGYSIKNKVPAIINLNTGDPQNLNKDKVISPIAFKTKKEGDKVFVALVGSEISSSHGTSNAHMVGGKQKTDDSLTSYNGVATGADLYYAATWDLKSGQYGSLWIPLARTIIQAAEKNVDVLDLDIFTPGTKDANDLLSSLLCRVTSLTNSVPVIASHNFGPHNSSTQSLSNSPCAIGVGASVTKSALTDGYSLMGISPDLKSDTDLMTTVYSGRGFALNGEYKPDILTPTYAYVSTGKKMGRFGGTSASTPATSGLILVLKQAAKLHGVTLNLNQIKFLLRNSSFKNGRHNPRDGYGYINMLETWKVFKNTFLNKLLDEPVKISGKRNLQFINQNVPHSVSLKLSRKFTKKEPNIPLNFKFWIEFQGNNKKINNWVGLRSVDDNSQFSKKIYSDLPIQGENFNLIINFKNIKTLPPGDHIAIIKGARAGLYQKNLVEVVMPISITVGHDQHKLNIKTKKLYNHDIELIHIKTSPGQIINVQGVTECLGPESQSFLNNPEELPYFLIKNEKSYKHSTSINNIYKRKNRLGTGIYQFQANSYLSSIAIARYKLNSCNGPIQTQLLVEKQNVDFDLLHDSTVKKDSFKNLSFNLLTNLGFTSNYYEYDLKKLGEDYLTIQKKGFNADNTIRIFPHTKFLELKIKSFKKFQGEITFLNEKKNVLYGNSTNDSYAAGLGIIDDTLSVVVPSNAAFVHIAPASKKVSYDIKMITKKIARSFINSTFRESLFSDADLSGTLNLVINTNSPLKDLFPPNDWKYIWKSEFKVIRKHMGQSITEAIFSPEITLDLY